MPELPLELRLAWRTILRRPWQPLVAALTLGVAVGAAGLIMAAVYDAVLRPLPYRAPERVLLVRDATDLLSPGSVDLLRRGAGSFSMISAYAEQKVSLRDAEHTRRIGAVAVDSLFFATLGVRPAAGRSFVAGDFFADAAPAVVVSHAFARRWTATHAIGATVVLEGHPYTVIGVMAAGVDYPRGTSVWIPQRGLPRGAILEQFYALARIAEGVSTARATAELAALSHRRQLDATGAGPKPVYHAEPFVDAARGGVQAGFWMLACSIGLLFLLTAGTLANLFLVRAVSRTHEIAVHAALGASGSQLFRQQVAESGLVSGAGTAFGCALVWLGATLVPRAAAAQTWWPAELTIDWRVVAVIALIGVALAAILGLTPLVQFRGIDLHSLLRDGANGVTGSGRQRRWRGALICGEISLVMFLVIATGVLAKAWVASERTDWGYDTRHMLFGTIMLPQSRFEPAAARQEIAAAVAARLRALPDVRRFAVFGEGFPGWVPAKATISEVDGYSGKLRYGPASPLLTIDTDSTFFETTGTHIVRGRGLRASDAAGAMPVAVIDERLAAWNWPGQDPVGHHIRFPGMEPAGPWYTIVGVASNAMGISSFSRLVTGGYIRPISVMYRSLSQVTPAWPGNSDPHAAGFSFVVHTGGDPVRLLAGIRRALADAAPDQPIENLGTLQGHLNADGLAVRDTATVLIAFAGFGVLLCVIGIVGLVADTVARRTREIGVRIALGAQWHHVIGIVMNESSRLACAGVVLGMVVSAGLVRVVGHYIFARGLGIDDPAVLFGAAMAVLVLVLAASLWPALRAMRVDPVTALRSE